MTVHRSYSCDLCNDKAQPIGKADLYGIYWAAGDALEIRGVVTVEHHLCRRCIESIQRFDIPKVKTD